MLESIVDKSKQNGQSISNIKVKALPFQASTKYDML